MCRELGVYNLHQETGDPCLHHSDLRIMQGLQPPPISSDYYCSSKPCGITLLLAYFVQWEMKGAGEKLSARTLNWNFILPWDQQIANRPRDCRMLDDELGHTKRRARKRLTRAYWEECAIVFDPLARRCGWTGRADNDERAG